MYNKFWKNAVERKYLNHVAILLKPHRYFLFLFSDPYETSRVQGNTGLSLVNRSVLSWTVTAEKSYMKSIVQREYCTNIWIEYWKPKVFNLNWSCSYVWWSGQNGASICDVLCNLAPFVQFKKRRKHQWRSVTFSNTPSLKSTLLHGLGAAINTNIARMQQQNLLYSRVSRNCR